MAQIVWSARSLKDIDEIAKYISKDSFQYAEEQVRQFFVRAKVLERQPLIGRMVPELRWQLFVKYVGITGLSMK